MELGVPPAVLNIGHGAVVSSAFYVADEACRGIVAFQAHGTGPQNRVAGVSEPVHRGGAGGPLLVLRPADVHLADFLPSHQDAARFPFVEARRLRRRGRREKGRCGGHVVIKHRKRGQGEEVYHAAATPGSNTTDEMCGGGWSTGVA